MIGFYFIFLVICFYDVLVASTLTNPNGHNVSIVCCAFVIC
jgi:hypothetical protein